MPMIHDSICAVVPVYNAQNTLEELVRRLSDVLGRFEHRQIVLVDDGSTDGSAALMKALQRHCSHLTAVMLDKNYGQQSAILCGLRECRCNCAVIIDDDLEQDPADIPLLYAELQKGYDVVYGVSPGSEKGRFRRFGSRLRDALFNRLTDKPRHLKVCSFRMLNRAMVDSVVKANTRFVYISMEMLQHTQRIQNIPVRAGAPAQSGYRPIRLMSLLAKVYVYYAPHTIFRRFRKYGDCYQIKEAYKKEDSICD